MTNDELIREAKRVRKNYVERIRYYNNKTYKTNIEEKYAEERIENLRTQVDKLNYIIKSERKTRQQEQTLRFIKEAKYTNISRLASERSIVLLEKVILDNSLYNLNATKLTFYQKEFKRLLNIDITQQLQDIFSRDINHFESGDEYEGLQDMLSDIHGNISDNLDNFQEDTYKQIINLYENLSNDLR